MKRTQREVARNYIDNAFKQAMQKDSSSRPLVNIKNYSCNECYDLQVIEIHCYFETAIALECLADIKGSKANAWGDALQTEVITNKTGDYAFTILLGYPA